jgi:hypothetical protein
MTCAVDSGPAVAGCVLRAASADRRALSDRPVPGSAQIANADMGTLTVTLAALPAAGNVLVMIGADEHQPLTNVTGGGVTTWMALARSDDNTNVEIWYGVTDGTSADVVLHGPLADTHPIFANVSEWSGLLTPNPFDTAHAHSGLVSPADPLAITTTHAHDLVLFGAADLTPNTYGTPGPGAWTALTPIQADISLAAWFRIVNVAGAVHPTVSETEGDWDAAVAALAIAP